MRQPYKIAYDKVADSMYIYLRPETIVSQHPFSDDIILDLSEDGETVGVEVIGFDDEDIADLRGLLGELEIDPSILTTIENIRKVVPKNQKELAVSIK